MATVYTIGHSTRTFDDLVAALKAHGVRTLVDIRSFPMSRRMPHFNRESLEVELPKHGIAYVWMKELGGRRRRQHRHHVRRARVLPMSPYAGERLPHGTWPYRPAH